MALPTKIETPVGPISCLVLDVSLGGARIETDQSFEIGESLWLVLHKVKAFGTVQWVKGNLIGIQFEERLPKPLVMSLRGEPVDPKELEAVEAMLVAQEWVAGTPTNRSKSLRLAEVLDSPKEGSFASSQSSGTEPQLSVRHFREEARAGHGIGRRALLLIIFSALIGALIGIASFLLF